MASKIIGMGIALPKRVVDNAELATRLGVSEKEIFKKTGIKSRHWVTAGETTSTLALDAAKRALQSAGRSAESIDLILVSTTSSDMAFPSTACLVQRGLKARPIPAFDLGGSCSGFLYALSVGDQYIKSGSAKNVLIISAEVKSPFLDPKDPATAILFGDGAAAAVLAEGEGGIRSIRLYADGARHRLIYLPAGGSRSPLTPERLAEGEQYMKMEGTRLFKMAVKKMVQSLTDLLAEEKLSPLNVDFFLFHQANLRILEAVSEKMKIPLEKSYRTISKYGNTSSSSLPIALTEAVEQGKIKGGERLVLCAFGGGLTWGTALIEW